MSETTKIIRASTEIKLGATYRTSVAEWTVEHIYNDGMILVRRDDGKTAHFKASQFLEWTRPTEIDGT